MRTLCWLLLTSLTALGDTYPRQPGVDAVHYTFRITVNDQTSEIAGDVTATMLFAQDGLRQFSLDLASTMIVSEVTSAASFTHRDGKLLISLTSPSRAGDRAHFTIRYHGPPSAGLYLSNNIHGEKGIFSANWPNLAHQWLPVIDHPYDKATSEFLVIAPAQYQVIANGFLEEERDLGNGTRLTHWRQSQPIASWLNTIGIARFAVRNFGSAKGVPLQTWVPWQDRDKGIETLEQPVRQAIEFYTDHIGPYPYDKLANVWAWSPGFSGGMEHASAIFYSCCEGSNALVWHEIAHQWFGDAVTERDWDDVWLSEGFATYFTHLTREHYEGRDAFIAVLKTDMARIFTAEEKNPDSTIIHNNLADMKDVLAPYDVIYQKGGWFLHMLRGQTGTEAFWSGIRAYYKAYRDSNASTADFQKVMEEASGQDLKWFFHQWLRQSPSPAIDATWTYNAARKKVEIDLTQTQPGPPYRLPLEVSVAGKIQRIEVTRTNQHFELASEQQPSAVTLDPNTWILMDLRLQQR